MSDPEKKDEVKDEAAGEEPVEDAPADEEKEPADTGPVLEMQDGEYQLHVLIE